MTPIRDIILVFGEDREARLATRRALVEHDYDVRVASGIAEATKALAAGDVALVVLTDGVASSAHAEGVQAAWSLPVIVCEPGSAVPIAELVRTALGAHDGSHRQVDGASE